MEILFNKYKNWIFKISNDFGKERYLKHSNIYVSSINLVNKISGKIYFYLLYYKYSIRFHK